MADEPTTSLDVTVAAEILQELTRLCHERKMALLLISHDLAMVGEYCDRIAVMYQGKMVETGDVKSILRHPQHQYTRSLLQAALHIQAEGNGEVSLRDPVPDSQSPILKVKDLKQYYTLEGNFLQQLLSKEPNVIKAVDGVSFELYPDEILGLVGESGCGKSTLSRTILQLVRPTSGKIEFLGQELTGLSVKQMRQQRRNVQMVFQDPHACLNPLMTVGASIADPFIDSRAC